MTTTSSHASWRAATLDVLWQMRLVLWAAIFLAVWFALFSPALAQPQPFPWPPPNTGCPPNMSCLPGGFPGGGNPGQCTPNPNGDPGCNGAGNPVDIITGNKYQREIDLAPLPGELGLHFSRHYNSNSTHRGLTGVGWRSTYEVVLVDLGSALQIIDADGRRLTFNRHAAQPSLCVGARPEDGRVIVDDGAKDVSAREASGARPKTRPVVYRWQRLDGAEYVFSGGSGDGHPLQSIRAASGATMTLNYLGGALDSVRDPQGRTLHFIYTRPLAAGSTRHRMLALTAIDTPVGRVSYKHDEFGRLQSAIQPNGLVHRYHYEPERQGAAHNTWALTGISIEFVQDGKTITERLATYVYDAQGRAVRTQHVGGDDLTLAYGPKAATTIATATGARTVYRHAMVAGQWQTVEAIGPGCATCPPSNVRYRYRTTGPQAGQLEATLRIGTQGKPLQQERVTFDAWGRPTRFERISYVNVKSAASQAQRPELVFRAEYHAMPEKLQSAELKASTYATLWRPKLVARPSTVPGYERSVAFSYNERLQPVMITETGVSPIDASGNSVPTALSRTTSYTYTEIAGVSRLTAIDGPLPGRADITTLHYDDVGRLRLLRQPADLQQRYAYDDAGRIVWHTPADAVPVRTTFAASGEPSTWQRGEAIVSVERDALGRPLRIEMPDGEVRWVGHDGPGELGAVISNRGWGHWQVPTLEAAQHLAQFLSNDTRADSPASSQLASAAIGAEHSTSTWGDVQVQRDDFGRLVTLRTQVTGLEVRRYDENDRLLERRFADGGVWYYERDAAGRVVAHAVAAPNADTVVTRVHWFGAYPIRVEHPNETEDRRFDSAGRLAERSIQRASGVRFTERFSYDAGDRLTSHDLPEGGTLRYAWGIGTQLRAVEYQSPLGRTQSLIGPLPRANAITAARPPTATDIALHTSTQSTDAWHVAAGGYRYGNGIEARWQLNAAGQLAALEHRSTEPAGGTQASWWSSLLAWIPAAWATSDLAPIAGWRYGYDPLGRMAMRSDATTSVVNSFGYDGVGRLVVSEPASVSMSQVTLQPAAQGTVATSEVETATREYYAYNGRGVTLGRRVNSDDDDFRTLVIERTAGGLPQQIGSRTLTYSADRRLIEVQESGRLLARYRHNAYGERIGKQDPMRSATDYLYARQQLVGETVPDRPDRLARRYVYAHGVPVAVIDYPRGQTLRPTGKHGGYATQATDYAQALLDRVSGRSPHIAYVHANEIGTPVAVTDSAQRLQWRAQYRVYGQAQEVTVSSTATSALDAYTLNLRLPGQYWDAETGWHDNYLRTYDPARGQYLEPDPLGPTAINAASSTQPFSYANHSPLSYADPLGLILFAFDGTGNNSNPSSIDRDFTNIWWMREYYDRSARGQDQAFYQRGIGTDPNAWDITNAIQQGIATQGHDFVREQLDNLSNYLRGLGAQRQTIPIDIIGFSRGAALARDFANQILRNYRAGNYGSHCLDFRFLGLFDTVSQFGVNGARDNEYDFTIASEWRSVAQAYALNEHRATFPLRSIGRGVERGFVGAHSDVGGGYNVAGESHPGDLSDVALNWMVQQATLPGVVFRELPEELRRVDQPVVHDQRNTSAFYGTRYEVPILDPFGIPIDVIPSDERLVVLPNGTRATQRSFGGVDPRYGSLMEGIIQRPPRWEYRRDNCAGQVDMAAYRRWLQANYGVTLVASPGEGTSTPCS